MKKQLELSVIPVILLSAFLLQSCGNVDIVKRRYRPGFHVDVSKKRQKQKPVETKTINVDELAGQTNQLTVKEPKRIGKTLQEEKLEKKPAPVFEASIAPKTRVKSKPVSKLNDFMLTPIREIKREKLNSGLRRAVFNNTEDDKYGWSTIAIVSTGLGVVGFGMLITGVILFASFIVGGGFAFWWLFLLLAILFGIAGMVTGIIGLRQTRRGEKRGRGFALVGMISGIVSLAAGLITMLWGFFYNIITRARGDS